MYNTKVECTYHTSEIFLENDNISDWEKNFIRDVLYRQELLDIFDINEYNEIELSKAIHELYEIIKHCEELQIYMLKMSKRFMSTDAEMGLMILYAYDYMYLSHLCVCEFIETGKISEHNICKLNSVID